MPSKKTPKRKTRQLHELPVNTTYTMKVKSWEVSGSYSRIRKPRQEERLGRSGLIIRMAV